MNSRKQKKFRMKNGAEIVKLTLHLQFGQETYGYVLASTPTDFVTWAVNQDPADHSVLEAHHGNYFQRPSAHPANADKTPEEKYDMDRLAFCEARGDYRRRAGHRVEAYR